MSETHAHPVQLRALAPGETHLTPAVVPQRGRARHLREKLAVLGAFAELALQAEADFDAEPALAALGALARREHPESFGTDLQGWHAPWLGWGVANDGRLLDHRGGWPEIGPLIGALPPVWRRAALLALAFDEDILVLDAGNRRQRWMVAALPGFWAPEACIGQVFDGRLPPPDHALLSRRASPTPRLHAHPLHTEQAPIDGRLWWRHERCTCWPVPGSRSGPGELIVLRRAETEPAS